MLFADSLKPRLRLGKNPLSSQLPVSAVDRPRTSPSQHFNVTILLLGGCPGLCSTSTLPIDLEGKGAGADGKGWREKSYYPPSMVFWALYPY